MGNSNSGFLSTLFSLLFKSKRGGLGRALDPTPEPTQVQPHAPEHHAFGGLSFAAMLMSGKLDEAFVERIETVIEHAGPRLTPEMVQQLLTSEQFNQHLDEPSRERLRRALAKATGQPLGTEPEKPAEVSPASPLMSPANAWQPDARTSGDADWHPEAASKGDDPWHPDSKTDDPWHPGAKKNDPWHPGD